MSAIAPYEVGDLLLAAGAYTAGEVEGGVIRRATSVLDQCQFPYPFRYQYQYRASC